MHKSGFVNIVGNPNVGKSTLMNLLVGERISIATFKAQTTRHRIMGIINDEDAQIVFSDTPGVLKPNYKLQESMLAFSESALQDADVLLYVTDPVEQIDKNNDFLQKVQKLDVPILVLINKIDLSNEKDIVALVEQWHELLPKAEILPMSALHKFNVAPVLQRIKELLPECPPYFDKDQLTDKPARFFVSEIIREKILLYYDKEIPYSVEVSVERFKEDTIKVIRENPSRLTEIRGIGELKAQQIAESYFAQAEYAEIMMQLSAYDITPGECIRIYRAYGGDSLNVLRENPYRLIDDVDSIGFKKADAIAEKLGFDRESEFRIKSGVLYMLSLAAGNGHSYLPLNELTEESARLLDVSREQVSDAAAALALDRRISMEDIEGQRRVMLIAYYRAEKKVASLIYRLCNTEREAVSANYERLIGASEKELGIELSARQKEAVISSLKSGVSIITGGPGTGKTTIIKMILSVLNSRGINTALAAPTGRAAKRMQEATGSPASTIHRLLEYSYSDDEVLRFARNEENPLDYDCVIIDEMSMVDVLLMQGLLSALRPETRLILVGDKDQLPPVGAGNVLKDMIASGNIHTVKLTEIFRQAEESLIVVNAHLINRGEYPSFNEKDKDFFMIQKNSQAEILETIKDLCCRRIPSFIESENPLEDIQVLSPTRQGMLGSVELNIELQRVLNPEAADKPELSFAGRIYRTGDKVMQNKNDYDIEYRSLTDFETHYGIYNGDLGIIQSVDTENGRVSVLFDSDRIATYDYSNLGELESAFAMTVHKSQGSEFPVVIMPQTNFPAVLATRNLLYTAVTRAKRLVVLVGNPNVTCAMVDNNELKKRNSSLCYRLNKLWSFDYEGI